MSVTVYFAYASKRRNSTLQATFSQSYDCVFKDATSLDRPTFLLSAGSFAYNLAKWGDRYYFIDDVVSVKNGLWEVSCILDVLATYKAEILASTQYVCYSSQLGDTWLPDTRIPVLKSASIHGGTGSAQIPGVFLTSTGFYCLTVNGKSGCESYALTKANIQALISSVDQWAIDDWTTVMDGLFDPNNPQSFSFQTVENGIESLSKILTQAGAMGNAYQNAPQMIRSCIWLPLNSSNFTTGGSLRLYLGKYDTGIDVPRIKTEPYKNTFTLTIPWTYSDWRRSICETVYLSLPYAGVINLPSDSLTGLNSLEIEMSICALDGGIAYAVKAGGVHPIARYGGSCAVNYMIGINQQSGLGDITQSLMTGAEKTIAVAVDSSIAPQSIAGMVAGVALEGVNTVYQVQSTAESTIPSCIGSVGGAAATGVSQDLAIYVVTHATVVNPADMGATMGRPTMKPLTLSTLTGFCQCANAHISAPAQAAELDAIDAYLNSGFYIE